MKLLKLVLPAAILAVAAPALGREPVKYPQPIARAGFQRIIADAGPLYISGQPTEAALRQMISRGEITTVINLRTRQETDSRTQVPYDEAGVLGELGVAYFQIPVGGADNPYTLAALDAFARALHGSRGKVLLHCTVAARASTMWAAYLVRYGRYDPLEAIRQAEAINLPPQFDTDSPMNRLLGLSLAQP
jgi:protein tyrosine phosphatase (PTP) superfamily phosphohydrolase (DUF442 family)